MSYTSPSNSNADATRFLAGDTDTTDELLTDAEYAYLLTEHGSVYHAAAAACEAISAKLARKVDTTVGRASKSLSQQAEAYARRARDLRRRAGLETATVKAGGISRSDKDTQQENDDNVQPRFSRGMHTDVALTDDNQNEA